METNQGDCTGSINVPVIKYVMCVRHGNGHLSGKPDCQVGKLYEVVRIERSKYCIPEDTCVWYVMRGDSDNCYASTLFEDIPRRLYESIKAYYKLKKKVKNE